MDELSMSVLCTREAYGAVGGFSESLYAGEDLAFVQALKKVGRFVVPKATVVTSARKLGVAGPWLLEYGASHHEDH
jgi:hypothetical protein